MRGGGVSNEGRRGLVMRGGGASNEGRRGE